MVTVAPATIAPDLSITVPNAEPVISCAATGPHMPTARPTTSSNENRWYIRHPLNLPMSARYHILGPGFILPKTSGLPTRPAIQLEQRRSLYSVSAEGGALKLLT